MFDQIFVLLLRAAGIQRGFGRQQGFQHSSSAITQRKEQSAGGRVECPAFWQRYFCQTGWAAGFKAFHRQLRQLFIGIGKSFRFGQIGYCLIA